MGKFKFFLNVLKALVVIRHLLNNSMLQFTRGNITVIDNSTTLELYVIREDLVVNPIPERADVMRTQAAESGGLCSIEIPAYTNTDGFLDAIVNSVLGSDCDIKVCRSKGCHLCYNNNTLGCVECIDGSTNCDGIEDVAYFKNCNCDAVVTINEKDEFALYTGE